MSFSYFSRFISPASVHNRYHSTLLMSHALKQKWRHLFSKCQTIQMNANPLYPLCWLTGGHRQHYVLLQQRRLDRAGQDGGGNGLSNYENKILKSPIIVIMWFKRQHRFSCHFRTNASKCMCIYWLMLLFRCSVISNCHVGYPWCLQGMSPGCHCHASLLGYYPHDDVIKWKHFPRNWPLLRGNHRLPTNSPQEGQWRGALMFSLICGWTNDWVNNRDAGDLRRHRAHYDVTVISSPSSLSFKCNSLGTRFQMSCSDLTSDRALTIVDCILPGRRLWHLGAESVLSPRYGRARHGVGMRTGNYRIDGEKPGPLFTKEAPS